MHGVKASALEARGTGCVHTSGHAVDVTGVTLDNCSMLACNRVSRTGAGCKHLPAQVYHVVS
jgi:hypothetical protein